MRLKLCAALALFFAMANRLRIAVPPQSEVEFSLTGVSITPAGEFPDEH